MDAAGVGRVIGRQLKLPTEFLVVAAILVSRDDVIFGVEDMEARASLAIF
mgnify:CR=1 FL=1